MNLVSGRIGGRFAQSDTTRTTGLSRPGLSTNSRFDRRLAQLGLSCRKPALRVQRSPHVAVCLVLSVSPRSADPRYWGFLLRARTAQVSLPYSAVVRVA